VEELVPVEVPEAWREAAEEVRAHLVAIRGGAPFLSPSDAWQLVAWLESGVRVGDLVLAVERAAEARRRKRARTPLTLGAVKRHLGRPSYARDVPRSKPGEPPLAALARALRGNPDPDGAGARLAASLADVRPEESGEREALAAIRTFVETRWDGLGDARRDALRARACDELGDLLRLVDEADGHALVEETARDLFRQGYPLLAAASVRALLA
jgi:hypothetical protein